MTTAGDPMTNAFLGNIDRRQIDKIQFNFEAEFLGFDDALNCGLSA